MNRIAILCVEDEPEVLDAILRDLAEFEKHFRLEGSDHVDDARTVLEECAADGDAVGLILCDHLLPGTKGVDFLIELNANPETARIRKVLITGQAGLEDTIAAVNKANLDHYISKPWGEGELRTVVKKQLTDYVIEQVEEVLPFVSVLDGARLMEKVGRQGVE